MRADQHPLVVWLRAFWPAPLAAARRELARMQDLAESNYIAAQRLDQARDAEVLVCDLAA